MSQNPKTDQELFEAVRTLFLEEEQQRYLAEACQGDDAQRNRVLKLVQVHRDNETFLEGLPPGLGDLVTVDVSGNRSTNEKIGPFRILKKLGEGGMGLVYLAEQAEPVKRRVALKVIKPGMDSQYVLARFETERQALSMMDHPNIARVFEAGSTSEGRPYFAMEWIQGIPITQYCDQNALSPLERLELFLPVCHAVHHAHQKGIIHRDLKPSNILVAVFDNRPIPKVIDFGLAKALATPDDQRTYFTSHGQIVGTIEYMSPEQASANHSAIDTRSDLYSLGIILYELLSGATPFDKRRLREAGWKEMIRIVKEETPPRPSTRLSSIDSPANVAALRKTDPHRLSVLLRGELDWIVMKAIEKQSNRRYESVLHLADDLNRFLRSETVLARPPSTFYSVSKFANRHRVALVFSSMILFTLIAGVIGTTFGMLRAIRSQNRAEQASLEALGLRSIAEHNSARATAAALASERARNAEREQRDRADAQADELAAALKESQALLYANQLMVVRTEARWGNPLIADHVLQETDPKKRGWEYAYLHGMLHENRSDLPAGYGDISEVALNDDGSLLAAACEDRKIRIWDTASLQLFSEFEGHPTKVTSVRFVPGQLRQILSGDSNGNVFSWDLDRAGKPKVLATLKLGIIGIEITKDGERAYVGGTVGTLLEISLNTDQEPKNIAKAKGMLMRGIALSPDEETIGIIGAMDLNDENSLLYLQDVKNEDLTQKVELGDWHGSAIEFSPDGSTIACGSAAQFRFGGSRGVRLVSVETGEVMGELTGNVNTITCIAFSSDGTKLYGGGARDGSVSVWDLTTMQISRKVKGLSGGMFSLALNDKKGILAGGGFSQSHLWNLTGRPFQQSLKGSEQLFRDAVIHANGTKVLASVGMPILIPHSDGKFDVVNRAQLLSWNLTNGRTQILADVISPAIQLVASPAGHMAASVHFDRTVRLWNLDTNIEKELYRLKVRDYEGRIAFCGDKELLIGDGRELKRIAMKNGTVQRTYAVKYDISELSADRAGKFAVVDSLKRFAVVDLTSGEELFHRTLEKWSERSFCFSTNGSRLIYVSSHREVECLSIPSGEIAWTKTIEGAQLGTFTLDDQRLILGSYLNVLVLDASTGSEILSLPAHEDLIQSVSLSPDNKYLVTVGLDNEIHVNGLP